MELKLAHGSRDLTVVHHAPAQVQYSCVADGLQASTGASLGKLNLRLKETKVEQVRTIKTDRKSGLSIVITPKPAFAASIHDLPYDKLEEAGRRVAVLPDDELFTIEVKRTDK